jgi:hypothetical protein
MQAIFNIRFFKPDMFMLHLNLYRKVSTTLLAFLNVSLNKILLLSYEKSALLHCAHSTWRFSDQCFDEQG